MCDQEKDNLQKTIYNREHVHIMGDVGQGKSVWCVVRKMTTFRYYAQQEKCMDYAPYFVMARVCDVRLGKGTIICDIQNNSGTLL